MSNTGENAGRRNCTCRIEEDKEGDDRIVSMCAFHTKLKERAELVEKDTAELLRRQAYLAKITRKRPIPTAEQVRRLFEYDPDTGILTWRVTRTNTAIAGSRAGWVNSKETGYRAVSVNGTGMQEARVIWLWMTGEWPEHFIDHINGIRDDNRWENLRAASFAENSRNSGVQKNNTSGYCGVVKSRSKWKAHIKFNGYQKYLGTFKTKEEASAAYEAASQRLFGEFKRARATLDRIGK